MEFILVSVPPIVPCRSSAPNKYLLHNTFAEDLAELYVQFNIRGKGDKPKLTHGCEPRKGGDFYVV